MRAYSSVLASPAWPQPESWTALHRESAGAPYELTLAHDNAIDAEKIVAELRAGEATSAAHTLQLAGAAPLYTRIGDRVVVACWFLTSLAIAAARFFQRSRGVE